MTVQHLMFLKHTLKTIQRHMSSLQQAGIERALYKALMLVIHETACGGSTGSTVTVTAVTIYFI